MIPLYRGNTLPSGPAAQRDTRFLEAHLGLWFERCFNQYDREFAVDEQAKSAFLKGIKSLSGADGQCGDRQRLEYALIRQRALVNACQGRLLYRQAAWNFATGLGNPHPVENGFLFHPTLAVPYLPGSSVKGLVRAWIERHLPNPQAALQRLFGSEDKDPQRCAQEFTTGDIVFFDALPIAPVKLVVDTMTPHMGKWYEKGDSAQASHADTVPADWHDPVPVQFLAANTVGMHFSFAPRRTGSDTPALLELVEYALKQALASLGAGAKTAAGYGVFIELSERQADAVAQIEKQQQESEAMIAEQAENDALSEEARCIKQLQRDAQQPNNQSPSTGSEFHRRMLEVVQQAKTWPEAEKKALAVFARQFFGQYASKKKRKEYMAAVRDIEG